MFLLIFYFSVAVVVSFFCSLLESSILSIPHSFIESSSKKYISKLKQLKDNINEPLSSILGLNTIANILGAAGVGAQVHKLYGSHYVTLFSIGLTLTILIVSEIIPKTLGATYWKPLAPFVTYSARFLMVIGYPVVQLSKYLQKGFGRNPSYFNRSDILGQAEIGVKQGKIYRNEADLIKNILYLQDRKISDIMTPRTVITAFKKGSTVKEVIENHRPLRFARIPVYDGDLDNIIGLVHRYKIFEASSQDCDTVPVESYLKPIHSVPESMSVSAAFDQFIKRKEHIFIVVDEYGSTSGLVTMEDVVETILGVEIVDELDSVADMREQARNKWKQKKSKIVKNGP